MAGKTQQTNMEDHRLMHMAVYWRLVREQNKLYGKLLNWILCTDCNYTKVEQVIPIVSTAATTTSRRHKQHLKL